MTRARWATFALVIVLAGSSFGCAGARNTLGTGASACYRALPPAESAINKKGKLVGVRRVSSATLRAGLRRTTSLATLPNEDLCVFAFNGTYPPGSVTSAHNTVTGHYAIVAVGYNHPTVVGAFVVNQLPTRFTHLH
jgi:hypothetical protein